MAAMSKFEIRANNIKTAIELARNRVVDFGYSDDSSQETVSRVVGMFITWLTACEEARQQEATSGASFTKNVIQVLPIEDDSSWVSYIMPPPNSTLRQRAESLWGIRITYTHGDGDIDLITNPNNKNYAINAPNILRGVSIENNKLVLNENVYHEAIRTMVQIRDLL